MLPATLEQPFEQDDAVVPKDGARHRQPAWLQVRSSVATSARLRPSDANADST